MDAVKRREFLNIPNYISLGRIVAVPLLIITMMMINDMSVLHRSWSVFWSLVSAIIYGVASLSDMVDGFIARRDNLVTNFGKIMDPIADKLLVLGAFLAFVQLQVVAAWMVVLILSP